MTREPQATTKCRAIRAACNTLFFNKLDCVDRSELKSSLATEIRFAQACAVLLLNQHVARVEHRPAERPGAD